MTKIPSAIVLDIDGVVLDWFLGFSRHMAGLGHVSITPYPSDYSMVDIYPGLTRQEIFAEIPGFNRSTTFGALPFIEGAEAGVRKLRALFPGSNLKALTSAGDNHLTLSLRKRNLDSLPFDDVTVLPLHVEKRPWFEKMPRSALVVEDSGQHALAAAEAGHLVFLLSSPWNQGIIHPGIVRAANWRDIIGAAATLADAAA